jgi:hypothetical protein
MKRMVEWTDTIEAMTAMLPSAIRLSSHPYYDLPVTAVRTFLEHKY